MPFMFSALSQVLSIVANYRVPSLVLRDSDYSMGDFRLNPFAKFEQPARHV